MPSLQVINFFLILGNFLFIAQALAQKADSLVLLNAVLYYHTLGSGSPIVVLSGGPGISAW